MSSFSTSVIDYWRKQFLGERLVLANDSLTVAVDPGLPEDRRVMVLQTGDARLMAVMTPVVADRLDLGHGRDLREPAFRQNLRAAGITLHGADQLFYFPEDAAEALLRQGPDGHSRQLTSRDSGAFAGFRAAASEQDLDDAYVELDHWAVFGAFEQDRLVCAASMYPWAGSPFADLGVLTLPPHRGRGHARHVVRAICLHALERGYEPQYRCQLDNIPSAALAMAAGLMPFGTWEVVSPDSGH